MSSHRRSYISRWGLLEYGATCAHAREDYPDRNDEEWMKHTLAWVDHGGNVKIDYRPVVMQTLSNDVQVFPPKARVY